MTKYEAKREMASVSSGTLASLTGINTYAGQDKLLIEIYETIDLIDVASCKAWQDVWNKIKGVLKL